MSWLYPFPIHAISIIAFTEVRNADSEKVVGLHHTFSPLATSKTRSTNALHRHWKAETQLDQLCRLCLAFVGQDSFAGSWSVRHASLLGSVVPP